MVSNLPYRSFKDVNLEKLYAYLRMLNRKLPSDKERLPIEITENVTEDVVFFIPGFTDREGELIRKKEAEIEKNLNSLFKKSGREKALELYNELIEKDLALTSYSSSAADKKQELMEKRDELTAFLK